MEKAAQEPSNLIHVLIQTTRLPLCREGISVGAHINADAHSGGHVGAGAVPLLLGFFSQVHLPGTLQSQTKRTDSMQDLPQKFRSRLESSGGFWFSDF